MKVLVCDDLPDRGADVVKEIADARQRGIEIAHVFDDELKNEFSKLFKKVASVLDDVQPPNGLMATAFDDADIVILDNNLAHLNIEGARLTAEEVAGYIRAFTNAPYVISLNKNPDVDFDLRFLIGDFSTRADLALNRKHLSNPALWSGNKEDSKDGFLPWYWPRLSEVPRKRREQIDFVGKHLERSVLETFNFPAEAIEVLSRHAKGTLYPNAESQAADAADGISLDAVTFQDVFMASKRSLPNSEDREALSQRAAAGSVEVQRIISRVVSAEVDLWFRRDVLGPQDALVDVPHLLMRMPVLLADRAGDIDQWNIAVTAADAPFGINEELYKQHIADAKFEGDIWVNSPCFWWPRIKSNETLNELFFAPNVEWADAVFCEDRSEFLTGSPVNGGEAPAEFAAEFEGSWNRRHVARIDGIRYAPKSRFAL